MKRAEKILVIIGAAGIAMKFFYIPGEAFLIILSLVFLSLIYLFLGFALFNDIALNNIFKKQSYLGISRLRLTSSILTGLVLFQSILGITFRIESFAGSALLLITGLFWLFIIFIITIIKLIKTKNIFYKRLVTRIAIVGFTGFVLYMTPGWRMAEIFHRDHPAYVQAMKNLSADPDNKELQDEAERERQRMMSSDKDYDDK